MTPSSTAPSAESRRHPALPNLIVIGAGKCGTSALHYYLGLHPEVGMSSPKELRFFFDRPEVPDVWATRGTWSRGPEWYASHFSAADRVRGESSPQYTSPAHPRVAERMRSVIPEARLIYLVRNPVDRMLSEYAARCALGQETRPADEALVAAENPYLARTRYHARLRPFLECFGTDRILVLASESLRRRRRETVRQVFEFLGVDPEFWSSRMERLRNPTGDRGVAHRALARLTASRFGHRLTRAVPQEPKWWLERLFRPGHASAGSAIPPQLRARLNAELLDEVEQLRELTGQRFEEWEL